MKIDIVLLFFILLDLIILNSVCSNKGQKSDKFWIWLLAGLLFMNIVWSIGVNTYLDVYQFNTGLNYIAILAGFLLLGTVRKNISNIFKDSQAIQLNFAKESNEYNKNEKEREKIYEAKSYCLRRIPLLNYAIKWLYREGRLYASGLIIVIVLGFFVRFITAIYGSINLDEGIHLYDAKLLTEGFLPFRDYFTREPYYIYSLGFLVKIFGANLITSRLFSVIASTVAILVIYILGKMVVNKKIGLIAATLFSFSPFIFYNGVLGNLYGVYPLITALFILIFLSLLRKPSIGLLIISGILLGAATHYYRLTIFYYPVVGFLWGMQNNKAKLKHLLIFYLPFSFFYLLPLVYFSIKAGYNNFEIIYGTNELVIAYFFVLIFYLVGKVFNKIIEISKENKEIIYSLIIFVFVSLALYSFFNIGMKTEYKARVLFIGLLQNYFLVFPLVVVLIVFLKQLLSNRLKLFLIIKSFIIVSMLFIGYYGSSVAQRLELWGARVVPFDFTHIFIIFYTASLVFLFMFDKLINIKKVFIRINPSYLWLLFFAPITFYLMHVQISATNYKSYIIPGSIFSAMGLIVIYEILKHSKLYIKIFLILMMIFLFYSPIYLYTQTSDRTRLWPQKSRIVIENYIKENTFEDEEIFTNALVYVVETNRRSANNVSRAAIYGVSNVSIPDYIGVSKELIPSKIYAEYINNNVNLLLIDNRSKSIFKTNSDFSEILNNYYLDYKWPQYEIEAWKKIK